VLLICVDATISRFNYWLEQIGYMVIRTLTPGMRALLQVTLQEYRAMQ
jgi:hypothetical protein